MKTRSSLLVFPLVLFLGSSISLLVGEGIRTWNDIYGRSFEAEIISTTPGVVRLKNQEGKEIDFQTTHLQASDQGIVRAWEQAKVNASKPSEFVTEFEKDLVIRENEKVKSYEPTDLAQIKYFAFYMSASWCPPCKKFTPKLVDFYNRLKPDHPEFELIFVSSDSNEDSMEAYMKSYKMPWPSFEFDKHKDLVRSFGGGIPCLVVTDANGKKLFDSYTKDKKYIGPSTVMREIETLLKN